MARSDTFVGRDEQLDELSDHWASARAGRGGFVVVSGEAGIGKTRLVEQLVDAVDGQGQVAWGSCPASDGPPLWPWRTVLGDSAGPAEPAPGSNSGMVDPAGATARRLAELADALRRMAASSPLAVVLDDLHRADPDSVALLRLVAPEARRLPLLVVATLRSSEVHPGSPLREVLADVAPSTVVIDLGGLGLAAVATMAAALTGRTVTPELTRAVLGRTGGNPFFVRELLRLLVAEGLLDAALTGAELPVPPLVRDVVLRRIGQLPAATRIVLDAAAVVGRHADLDVVAAVSDLDAAALARAVETAEAARLLEVVAGGVRFAHDLVRDALVDDLDPGLRRQLHHAAAGALRRIGGPSLSLAAIATHLCAALPAGDPEDAAAAALAAAGESLGLRAPGDAVGHAERGLAALGATGSAMRGVLLLAVGDARTALGDRKGARAAYAGAADAARAQGDIDTLATAALGFAGVMGAPRTDQARVDLLEEAATGLQGRRDPLTARVRARLAHALLFSDQGDRCRRLADEAVALARELADDDALVHTLYVWNLVHVTTPDFETRRRVVDELLALGRASGDDEVEALALHEHAHDMAEAGDFAAFDAEVAAGDALARRAHSATWQWSTLARRAMRAAMQGRFEEAEALGDQAFELGVGSQHGLAAASLGAHLLALRTWQGRLDELLPMIAASAGRFTGLPGVQAAVPFAHAELGQLAEAGDALDRLATDRFLAEAQRGQSWTAALAMLARAAALTGDADVAARLLEHLRAWADRHVISPLADAYYGPMSLYLGMSLATTGDDAAAAAELARAVGQAEAGGARPAAAWARAELADVLDRLGRADDASELRKAARAEMETLGMPRHLARLGTVATTAPNVFRAEGGTWEISFAGRTARLRATKGLADLHRLVRAAGTELHVLELTGGVAAGSRQPVLDEQAKAAYRRRLLDLEAEIDDARAAADLARAERSEAEHDAVVAELAAALGLGGRDRSMADEAERARQAVRARIRYTLDRLGEVHPQLRQHLDHALVTGTFCSYRPEQPTAWVTE